MKEALRQIVDGIRESANHISVQLLLIGDDREKNLLDEWVAVSLALDTLEDATVVLLHYESSGPGSAVPEKFLRVWGMFQAVILQQQAISRLSEVFIGSPVTPDYDSAWQRITDVFQLAVSCPLEGWRPSDQRSMLTQIEITEEGFYIAAWDRDAWDSTGGETTTQRIDPMELLLDYLHEAAAYLKKIAEAAEARSH